MRIDKPIKVLLMQRHAGDTGLLLRLISTVDITQFELNSADSLSAVRQKMLRDSMDILLLDIEAIDENIRDTLEQLVNDYPMTSIVIIGDAKSADYENELLQLGVKDFIDQSQISGKGLERVIRNAIDRKNLLRELHAERRTLNEMFYAIEKGEIDLSLPARDATPLFKLVDNFLIKENAKLLSKLREQESRLRQLSYRDMLTGLDNGAMFEHTLKRHISFAKRRQNRLGVISLDINQFQMINETYGHLIGDQILRQIAVRLSQIFRSEDGLARIASDNFFLVVIGYQKTADLSIVARKVLDNLSEPFLIDDCKIKITACMGISELPRNGGNVDTLMKNADIALKKAKKIGKNVFQFATDELCGQHLERLHLENDLENALNLGQFFLVYQPIIELNTEKVVAIEALIRWKHPHFGQINPADFLPIAERTGYILEIGRWVIEQALHQLAIWRHSVLKNKFKVSINLSPLQFHDTQLTQCIGQNLSKNKLDYHDVEFDVTEKALIQDESSAVKILAHIASLGGAASIDDFGSGFHSLEQMKSLPLSTLKIASRFIQKIDQNEDANKMVQIIINLARQLGLKSLAETVETEAQYQFLKNTGCDRAQGYFISRPLTPDLLQDFLKNHE